MFDFLASQNFLSANYTTSGMRMHSTQIMMLRPSSMLPKSLDFYLSNWRKLSSYDLLTWMLLRFREAVVVGGAGVMGFCRGPLF